MKKRRAPTALTLECDVCSAPAPDHFHFGGHCCYSCRAFFRRTIERMEKLDVVCRTGNSNCEVSEKSKSCSACRYDKCLSIGMKKELLQVHSEQFIFYCQNSFLLTFRVKENSLKRIVMVSNLRRNN